MATENNRRFVKQCSERAFSLPIFFRTGRRLPEGMVQVVFTKSNSRDAGIFPNTEIRGKWQLKTIVDLENSVPKELSRCQFFLESGDDCRRERCYQRSRNPIFATLGFFQRLKFGENGN